jgi:hypothetical protein
MMVPHHFHTRCPLNVYAKCTDQLQPILHYFSEVAEVSKRIELPCGLHRADTLWESQWKPCVDIVIVYPSI